MTLKASNSTVTLKPTEVGWTNVVPDTPVIVTGTGTSQFDDENTERLPEYNEFVTQSDLIPSEWNKPHYHVADLPEEAKPSGFYEPGPEEIVQLDDNRFWIIKTLLDRIENLEEKLESLLLKIEHFNRKSSFRIE